MKRYVTFLTFLLLISNAVMASGTIPVDTLGLAAKHPSADVIVLFDSTIADVQESGLSYVKTHRMYYVQTVKGGLDLRVIKYDYDPLSAHVEIEKVVVYHKSGKVRELDVSQVMDYPQPARAIYWGAREKMIEVGRLEPGDLLEMHLFRKGFTYALLATEDEEDRYVPPMRGHFYDIIPFWSDDPVEEKVYITKIPASKQVQYKFYNGSAKSSAILEDDKMVYTFSVKDIKPMKREPNMVAWTDVAPELIITTSPDWYAKSTWFYGVNEDYGSFESTPEIDAKVEEILEGAKDELDSISLLTHWVADEIRYSGISMGQGEGYTLHTGDMTFNDRCGVCKDKAGMLVTMLRAAGFESYAAMTMAGSRIDDIPADQFNHSVTVVKRRDGTYQLLDPTWVPFVRELWSSAEQQQNYLMGLPEGADLMVTDVSPPGNHFIRIYGNSELDYEGNLNGEVNLLAEGQSDAAVRRMFTSGYKDQWEYYIERELKAVHPGAKVLSVDFRDPYEHLAGPIKLKIQYEIPNYAIIGDGSLIVKSLVASGIFKRALSHLYIDTGLDKREYPFRDRCSRFVKFNESIKLPGEYDLVYAPFSEKLDTKTAFYEGEISVSLTGKTLRMIAEIVFEKRIYEPDEWSDFRKAVLAHRKLENEPVVLKTRNTQNSN